MATGSGGAAEAAHSARPPPPSFKRTHPSYRPTQNRSDFLMRHVLFREQNRPASGKNYANISNSRSDEKGFYNVYALSGGIHCVCFGGQPRGMFEFVADDSSKKCGKGVFMIILSIFKRRKRVIRRLGSHFVYQKKHTRKPSLMA